MNQYGDLRAIGQCLIEYMEDLLTASPKEAFSKVEILVLLNSVKNDEALMGMLERASRPDGTHARINSRSQAR